MSFGFSAEQGELRQTVRAFLAGKAPEVEARRLMETEDGFDAAVWSQMAGQLGWHGLAIPEELGGSGYSFVELAIVLEEMGRVLLVAPFFSSAVLAAGALLHSGDDAAKKDLLPGIASGATIATLAVTEASGRWDEPAVTVRADHAGDGYTLTGTKTFVTDGALADLILVEARTDAGVSLFAVDGRADGVRRERLFAMDQTRKLATIELTDAPARLIGADGDGWRIVERALQLGAIGLAAEQVGGAQRCMEISVEYAKDRIQFGRQIGSFQAVKHKCADMLVQVELAKSAVQYAASCAATDDADLPVAAAMAKSYCSTAFLNVAAETIQVHGGIGFTWEHPAHLYFKRAKSSQQLLGTPRHHRRLLAQRVGI